jgi:hypothetical protein
VSTLEVPEPWAELMRAKDLTDRGKPSIAALGRKAGVSAETARRAVHGIGRISTKTASGLRAALGPGVLPLLGVRVSTEPYVGPAASALLTPRQRKALDELIHAFTQGDSAVSGIEGRRVGRAPQMSDELENLALAADDRDPIVEQDGTHHT